MPALPLALTLKNDPSEIARSAEEIEAYGESHGWPMKWIMNLNLSLDELITNIISYGYRDGEEHEIRITLTEEEGSLTVVLEDDGIAFDPLSEVSEPDLDADVEERRIGGLGVHFVKSLMDEVAYERRDGRNRLTLIQRSPG